jgi:hypothetical protein
VSTRADYTDAEQAVLWASPWAIGLAAATADSGASLVETFAIASAVSAAAERYPGNQLLASLWGPGAAAQAAHPGAAIPGGPGSAPGASSPQPADRPLAIAIETCRKVETVLQACPDPDEADGFRRFLADVALDVAEASTSGGVFGIGGVRVTPAEAEIVEAVRDALGLEPLVDADRQSPPGAAPAPSGEPIQPE